MSAEPSLPHGASHRPPLLVCALLLASCTPAAAQVPGEIQCELPPEAGILNGWPRHCEDEPPVLPLLGHGVIDSFDGNLINAECLGTYSVTEQSSVIANVEEGAGTKNSHPVVVVLVFIALFVTADILLSNINPDALIEWEYSCFTPSGGDISVLGSGGTSRRVEMEARGWPSYIEAGSCAYLQGHCVVDAEIPPGTQLVSKTGSFYATSNSSLPSEVQVCPAARAQNVPQQDPGLVDALTAGLGSAVVGNASPWAYWQGAGAQCAASDVSWERVAPSTSAAEHAAGACADIPQPGDEPIQTFLLQAVIDACWAGGEAVACLEMADTRCLSR